MIKKLTGLITLILAVPSSFGASGTPEESKKGPLSVHTHVDVINELSLSVNDLENPPQPPPHGSPTQKLRGSLKLGGDGLTVEGLKFKLRGGRPTVKKVARAKPEASLKKERFAMILPQGNLIIERHYLDEVDEDGKKFLLKLSGFIKDTLPTLSAYSESPEDEDRVAREILSTLNIDPDQDKEGVLKDLGRYENKGIVYDIIP